MAKTEDNIAWSNKKIIDTLETYHYPTFRYIG